MEQSPSLEANQFLASQVIPRILWKPKGSLPRIWCMCDRASYMKMTRGTKLM